MEVGYTPSVLPVISLVGLFAEWEDVDIFIDCLVKSAFPKI